MIFSLVKKIDLLRKASKLKPIENLIEEIKKASMLLQFMELAVLSVVL
ncbi:MAG: hypothetical protein QW193_05215 [Nitrososphaerales archaeon]